MKQDVRVRAAAPRASSDASALLACGVVAGPLFVVVALVQAFGRSGFELSRHPLSLLSLGSLGWIQIANFVVTGCLFVACAVGMDRSLVGLGAKWAPRLVGVFGASLIIGGVFVADPAFGFPLGTPEGAPDQLSWHGIVHGIAPVAGFLALILASIVFARRFAHEGRRGWATAGLAIGVIVLATSMWPNVGGDPEGKFLPLWGAMVLGFGWASALPSRVMTEDAERVQRERTAR